MQDTLFIKYGKYVWKGLNGQDLYWMIRYYTEKVQVFSVYIVRLNSILNNVYFSFQWNFNSNMGFDPKLFISLRMSILLINEIQLYNVTLWSLTRLWL